MKTQKSKLLAAVCAALATVFGAQQSFAAASVTTATGGVGISVDNVGGAFTALTGPVFTETDNTGMPTGTMILSAPAGFQFDTTANSVSVAITGTGTGTDATLAATTVTPTASTITLTVSAISSSSRRTIFTFSGIKVRPTSGSLIAPANLSYSGTSSGVTSGTALGTLTVIPGAPTQLAFTTQPAGATYGAAFTTQPVVRTRDQFGNTTTNGLPATLNISLALTTGTGPLTGTTTLNAGTGGTLGVAAFSGLALGTVENGVVLTASASGFNTPNSAAFNVTPKTLTVTGITASNKIYDQTTAATLNTGSATLVGVLAGDALTLDATAASGTFANATVGNNKTVTVAGLTVTGAGAANYTLTQPTATANITAKALTVNGVTANNKVYNGSTAATLVTAGASLVGVISGDTVTLGTVGANGVFSDNNVGTGKTVTISGLTISGSSAGNYQLTQPATTANITPATLTVTATGVNRVYDGTTNATATLANNRVSGDVVTITNESVFFATKTVGNAKAVTVVGIGIAGGADAGNYVLGNTTAATTANITAKGLTISGATAGDKVYDRTTTAILNLTNAALVGIVSGDDVTLNSASATGTFSSTTVANNKTVTMTGFALAGTDAGNYSLTQPSDTANITAKPLTVTGGTVSSKTYNGNTTAAVSGTGMALVGVISPDTVTLSTASVTGTFSDKNVGANKTVQISGLTIGGASSGNYSVVQPTNTANITAATLTITATAPDRVYDGTTNSTVTLTDNRVSGDSVTVTNAQAFFATKTVGNTKTVTAIGFGISGGADAGNYILGNTSDTDTANITAKALSISGVAANDKIYDRTTTATFNSTNAALVGVISNEVVTLSSGAASGTFSSSTVGTGKTVTASGFTISGTDAANYSLSQPTGLTAAITAKPLTVTGATASNKTYDGTTTATASRTGASLVGVISPDAVTLGGTATGTFSDKHVGTGKSVQVAGLTISGAASGNYTVTQPIVTANIAARPLTITANASTKTYDGATNATATPSITTGVVQSGDAAAFIEAFSNKNVGTGKTLIPSGIVNDGNGGTNYTYTFVNNTAGVINALPITVTAAADAKIYDGNNTSAANPTITVGTIQSGDAASFLQTFDNKEVGTGKTLAPSGSVNDGNGGANYAVTFANNIAGSITARTLNVTASAQNKTYNGDVAATVTLADDRISGDVLTISASSATFDTKNVGAAKPVTVSGLSLSGADANSYSLASTSATTTADIAAALLTVTPDNATRVYAAANPTFTGIIAGLQNSESIAVTYSTTATSTSPVGNYPITAEISDPNTVLSNYAVTTNSGTLTVTKATLIATANNATRNAGQPNPTFTASYSGFLNGDTSAVISGSPEIASIADTNSAPGSYPIVATNGTLSAVNYDFAFVEGTLTVLTADSLFTENFSRDTDPGSLAPWQVNSGLWTITGGELLGGPNSSSTYGFAYIPTNWVNYSVEAKLRIPAGAFGAGLGGRLDASSGAHYAAWVYPEGSAAGSNVLRLIRFSDWANWTQLQQVSLAAVGTNAHTIKLSMVGNQITVDFDAIQVINTTDSTLSSGGITADGWTDAAPYVFGVDDVQVIAIKQNQTITFAALANKTYGDATFSVSASASSSLPVSFNILSGPATISGNAITITGVGSITVRAAQAGDASYNAAPNVDQSFTVTPAIVTGSVTAASKVYDGSITAAIATRSLAGVIGLDDVTLTGGSANFDDKNVGSAKTVTAVGLSLAGNHATNYTLAATSATTTADIAAASLTGSVTANSKIYDASASAVIATRSLSGVIGSEDVSLVGGSASFVDKNVAVGKTVSVTGLSLSGADIGNYTLASGSLSTTADITARSLTVSATAQNKVYNGDAVALVTLSDDRISGDVVAVGFTSAVFNNKNVGPAKPVTVSGLDLSGADAGNYSLISITASSSADITTALLTSSITANNKTYDGNTNATIATRSLTGVIGLDDVSLVGGAASFADKNIGTGKPVSVAGLTLNGVDAANYTLTSNAATTAADITVRTLISTATAQNKIYDGNATAAVSLSDDRINGDDLTISSTGAEFASKDVGVAKLVSVVGISMVGADAGNYLLASTTASTSADITAATLTGSITADNKIYDGNTAATISTRSLTGVIGSDDVSLTGGAASFGSKSVGAGKAVSATGLVLSGADAINYTLTSTSAATTADITAAPLAGSITANSKIYDGNASATIATRTLAGVIGSDDVNLIGGAASFADKNVAVGKMVSATGLSLNGVEAGNYALVSDSATTIADITARALAVSATAQNKVYDGNTTALVSLADDRIGGDVLTVSETSASFADKNVGAAKPVSVLGISISGTDASNYTLANTAASSNADITARSLVISAAAANKVYDGNTDAVVTLSDDHVASDDIAVSHATASFDNKNVGAGKPVSVSGISMSGVDVSNYVLASTTALSSADISVRGLTVTATAQHKVYDGNTNAVVSLADNRVSGDVLTATNTASGFEDGNVGSAKNVNVLGLSISGADAGNYALANASAMATADITPVQLIVTADNKSRAYAVTNPTLTATISGFVNGETNDVISGSADLSTLADTNSPVGSYPITVALGTLSATNYTFSLADGSLTITPFALTVTAANQSRAYGAANPILTGSLTGLQNGDNISAAYATSAATNSPVGTYPITVSLADPDGKLVNYSVTTNEGSLAVTAATLTVTAANQTRVYGSANPELTATIAGFVNGEDNGVLTGSAAISTAADAATAVGNYPITAALGTLNAVNYTFSFVDGSLAITAASLAPTVTVGNKVYDGAAAAAIATRSLAGVIGSDDVSLQGGAASFSDKNVGATKSVSVTGLNLTGAAAGNYSLASTSANTTADITPAPVTAHVAVQNKVYDGTIGAVIAGNTLVGVIAPDDVTLATAAANFTDKNVGAGKTVVVTSLTLGGADADNYALVSSDVAAQADIMAATLSGSITSANKIYDGNAAATIETRSLDNVIGSDEVTLVGGVASFADKNVGSSKTVSATGLSLSGTDAGNYSLASVSSSTTADITIRSLNVTALAQSKVYDGTATATVALADDRISGDLLALSYTGASFDNKNVGAAKLVSVSGLGMTGTDAVNYSLANSTTTSSADITAAMLTGDITANSKVYDGNISAAIATRTLAGVVGSDDVALSGGTASFADKNVGVGKAVSATGLTLSGADVANYTLASGSAATTADITAVSLTASVTVSDKVYDGNASATIATRSLTGVIAPDDVTLVGGSAAFNNKNVGSGKSVAVTGMVLGGAGMANYSLASGDANTAADITAASLTGSITVASKAYDGNNSASISSRSLAGVIGSDDVSLSGGTATFNNKNVDVAKPVTASGLSLVGADLANYALVASSASTTADITAVALTVTADDKSRNYGEANPALTGILNGGIAGDNITASYSTTATIASVAGTYAITALLNDPDNNLGNYIVTSNSGTFTIISLTPSTIGGIEKLADGNMHIVVSGTPGQVYHLQAIGDLSGSIWSNIGTNTANGSGVVEFDDLSATNHLSRFYRISTP